MINDCNKLKIKEVFFCLAIKTTKQTYKTKTLKHNLILSN